MTRATSLFMWVSCATDAHPGVARDRHLVKTHADLAGDYVTTLCGSTGSPQSWVRNTKKPKCVQCVSRLNTFLSEPPTAA